jgi:hypothetical protein
MYQSVCEMKRLWWRKSKPILCILMITDILSFCLSRFFPTVMRSHPILLIDNISKYIFVCFHFCPDYTIFSHVYLSQARKSHVLQAFFALLQVTIIFYVKSLIYILYLGWCEWWQQCEDYFKYSISLFWQNVWFEHTLYEHHALSSLFFFIRPWPRQASYILNK